MKADGIAKKDDVKEDKENGGNTATATPATTVVSNCAIPSLVKGDGEREYAIVIEFLQVNHGRSNTTQ